MLSILLFFATFAFESQVVGVAAENTLTSRQVNAHVIFSSLYKPDAEKLFYSLPLKSQDLMSATSNLLMEFLIVEDAKSFQLATLSKNEVKQRLVYFKRAIKQSQYSKNWNVLQISDAELLEIAQIKLRAVKFLQTKMESFTVPISEVEINARLEQYKKNHPKMELASLKEKIKVDLKADKIQSDLREWFQLLRTKYVVKNLLIQS